MRIARTAARALFHAAGGVQAVRHLNRNRLRILTYHRFSHVSRDYRQAWRQQCEHIKRFYTPVSLSQAVSWIGSGTPFPKHSLLLTVDDGFRDFFTIAYPVLSEFGIPATVYLVSDFLDGKDWLWWNKVDYAIQACAQPLLRISLSTGEIQCPIETPQQRDAAVDTVIEALKQVPDPERLRVVSELPQTLKVSLPPRPPEPFAPLSWDEARNMAEHRIEFGAHTMSHPILSRVLEQSALRYEIEGSKKRIEQELQSPVAHFCYPNGDHDARVVQEVKQAGFKSAVTTELGLNDPGADLLQLKRIYSDVSVTPQYFRQGCAGLRLG
jgi:peptidoglycan/xylan/chitin deacetylase (PgdA/CDA1 family)